MLLAALVGVAMLLGWSGSASQARSPELSLSSSTSSLQRPKAAPSVANVWVDTSGGSCRRASAPATYSDPAACGTLDSAHAAAQPGDLVFVKGGRYGEQLISRQEPAPAIVIAEAKGESATFTKIVLDNPTSNLELRDLAVGYVDVGGSDCSLDDCGVRAQDIVLRRLDFATFSISYVDGVRVLGGDVGPGETCNGVGHPVIGNSNPAPWAPKNVLVDSVFFHDFTESNPSCDNTECLYVWAADGVTVQNNVFKNCLSTGAIYVTLLNLPGTRTYCQNVTVQNNLFLGHDNGSRDYVHFESDCSILLRYNSFGPRSEPRLLSPSHGPAYQKTVRVIGNYGLRPSITTGPCGGTGFVFEHNVWVGRTCGPTDRRVSRLDYVNPPLNLHLKPRANAIDRGSKANYPPRDRDGRRRYRGAAPDAGAHERS